MKVTNLDSNKFVEHSILLLSTIFEHSKDGVVFKDRNLNYITANKVFYDLNAISDADKVLGTSKTEHLNSINQNLLLSAQKEVLSTGISKELNINFEKDNKYGIYNVTINPVILNNDIMGIICVIKDRTVEETVKKKIFSRHEQMQALFDNVPLIIFMRDKNENFIAGTKYADEFIKQGFDSRNNIKYNKEDIQKIIQSQSHITVTNDKSVVKEYQLYDIYGKAHWYKMTKCAITDEYNDVYTELTLLNNIDSIIETETQRETFVATISHDLKNPTIAQIRALELLLNNKFGNITKEQREVVEMTYESCKYMNAMLYSLLATYRNDHGNIKLNYTENSMKDLVAECVSEMLYLAKVKNVEIELNNQIKEPLIFEGDKIQIKRVVTNLLSNGIKYAYNDTVLKIDTYTDNDCVCFKFENNSPYIPPEKQKVIFNQYVTFAEISKEIGIGLGLYASQRIVKAHGGMIFMESFEENRNIFGFKIPAKAVETDKERLVTF